MDENSEKTRVLAILRGTLDVIQTTTPPGASIDGVNLIKVLIKVVELDLPADVFVDTYRESAQREYVKHCPAD